MNRIIYKATLLVIICNPLLYSLDNLAQDVRRSMPIFLTPENEKMIKYFTPQSLIDSNGRIKFNYHNFIINLICLTDEGFPFQREATALGLWGYAINIRFIAPVLEAIINYKIENAGFLNRQFLRLKKNINVEFFLSRNYYKYYTIFLIFETIFLIYLFNLLCLFCSNNIYFDTKKTSL